LSVAAG